LIKRPLKFPRALSVSPVFSGGEAGIDEGVYFIAAEWPVAEAAASFNSLWPGLEIEIGPNPAAHR